MKILYINGKNNNGGANIALLNIIKGMMAEGHEVHVITDIKTDFFLNELKKTGCYYYSCRCALNIKVSKRVKNPITILNYYIYNLYTWYCQKKYIKQKIEEIHPDIVHTNIGPLITAAEVCENLKIPHVWHIREYGEELGFRIFPSQKYFLKLLKRDNNYCIAITKGIFKHYNMRDNQDIHIYDGVFSQNLIGQSTLKEKKDYILFVGRIEEIKGVTELLSAYAIFHAKEPKYKLLLVGQFDPQSIYYKECKNFIESKGLKDVVEFLGVRNDVYELMSYARFLIVCSPMEGFGFVATEAMLNYCLVIGKDAFGIKEQFDNGFLWTGSEIAYRYDNIEDLVNRMCNAINDNNTNIVIRAHQVLFNYTIESSIKQIDEFYKRILKK